MPLNYLRIAELDICLDAEPDYIPAPFEIFSIPEQEHTDLHWRILEEAPPHDANVSTVVDSPANLIQRTPKGAWQISFPKSPAVLRLDLYEESAILYLNYDMIRQGVEQELVLSAVSYALEMAFFYAVQRTGRTAVHASVIIYRNYAYLFSAPSGTGKTTHTTLWRKLYPKEVEMLNGDVAVCGFRDGIPLAWGLPWSGTAGVFRNISVPVGGFVFLRRAQQNQALRLQPADGGLQLASRCFAPAWNTEMMKRNLDISGRLSARTPCYLLNCLPHPDAVREIKGLIDQEWSWNWQNNHSSGIRGRKHPEMFR